MNFWVVCGYGLGHGLVGERTYLPSVWWRCMWEWILPPALQNKYHVGKKKIKQDPLMFQGGESGRKYCRKLIQMTLCDVWDMRAQRKNAQMRSEAKRSRNQEWGPSTHPPHALWILSQKEAKLEKGMVCFSRKTLRKQTNPLNVLTPNEAWPVYQ